MPLRHPLAAALLLCAWVLVTSVGQRGDPWPVAGAVMVGALAFSVGWLVPRTLRTGAALSAGAAGLGAVLLGSGSLSGVLSGPLGYANANAALVVAACGCFGLVTTRGSRLRWVGWSGAAACLAVALAIGAVAATAGCLLVLGTCGLALAGRLRVATALSVGGLLLASSLAFVVGSLDSSAATSALTERRVDLWTEGVAGIPDEPLLGHGARRFAEVSATAAGDPDTREAHAELLQRAVENGVPGLALELIAIATVAVGLIRRRSSTAVVGLAVWTAVWANAGVDWILAFPVVTGLTCFATGLAAAPGAFGATSRGVVRSDQNFSRTLHRTHDRGTVDPEV